jgi:hypothetical protein
VPQPDGLPGIEGYAAELGLATELPAAITQYRGQWIEYGVAERAYALQCSDDFAAIVGRYGHTAIRAKKYTASAFLAGVLGGLSRHGALFKTSFFRAVTCTARIPEKSRDTPWSIIKEQRLS